MGIVRKIGAVAAATATVAGLSLAGAAPAEASIPPTGTFASIVTPRYGLSCNLGVYPRTVAGVTQYEGSAICFAAPPLFRGPWQVKVNCTAGGNYYSGVFTPTKSAWIGTQSPAIWCFWGVNSVEVLEV